MPRSTKIAVAGATGRVGSQVAYILDSLGYDVVPISRSQGVDVITGEGLDRALMGVETIIDAATGPSPDQQAATEFFTTAARNLQEAGERAGVRRLVLVSIIGIKSSRAATTPPKSRRNRPTWRARSRRASCARPSSTSSWKSSSGGAPRET